MLYDGRITAINSAFTLLNSLICVSLGVLIGEFNSLKLYVAVQSSLIAFLIFTSLIVATNSTKLRIEL